jgi:hypothetical protein
VSASGRVFTTSGFVIRLLFAVFIVFIPYNSTRYSFIYLVRDNEVAFSLKLVVGLILLTLNVYLLVTAMSSLRTLGITLVVLNCFAIAFWLHSAGIINLWRAETLALSILTTIAVLNAAGLCFSLWCGRLSGLTHIAH